MNARSCRQSGCLHKALSPHLHIGEIDFCTSRLLQFEAHAEDERGFEFQEFASSVLTGLQGVCGCTRGDRHARSTQQHACCDRLGNRLMKSRGLDVQQLIVIDDSWVIIDGDWDDRPGHQLVRQK